MRFGLTLLLVAATAVVSAQDYAASHGFGNFGSDTAYGVAADSSGNTYSCGHFDGPVDLQPGTGTHTVSGFLAGYVVKYDAARDVVWSAVLETVNAGDSCIPEMPAADAAGNVYVVGRFTGSVDFDPGAGTQVRSSIDTTSAPNFNDNAFILKLDANGAFQWVHTFAANMSWGMRVGTTADRVCFTGIYVGSMDLDPGAGLQIATTSGINSFIVMLDDAGAFLWAEAFAGMGLDLPSIPMIDAAGVTFVTSFVVDLRLGQAVTAPYLVTTGNADGLIIRFTAAGVLDWYKLIAGVGANVVPSWAQADSAGNIYICGNLRETADFDPGPGTANLTATPTTLDGWVARYSPTGDFDWVRGLHSPADVTMLPLAPDDAGVCAGGTFVGTVDLDPGQGSALHSANTGSAFIVRLDAAGDYQWSVNFGDTSTIRMYGMASDGAGNVIAGGPFEAAGDFDPGPGTAIHTPAGSRDGWMLWLEDGTALPPLEITTQSLPNATVGNAVNEDIIAQGGSGSGYQWTLESGALPPGVGGIPGAGTPAISLAGTPTQSGTFNFRLRVEDDQANVATHDFAWIVDAPPLPQLLIQTISLPDGMVGSLLSESITAQGGTDSGYQWSLDSGALPPGISGIPGSGTPFVTLDGTPAQDGTFNFRVRVTDDGANFETQDFTWIIHPAPLPPLVIQTATLPGTTEGTAVLVDIAAQGGTDSGYQWTLESGALPTGVSGIPGSGTPSVVLSGAPSQSGVFNFRVRVDDDGGNFATRDFTWTIASAPPPASDNGSGSSGSSGCATGSSNSWLWLILALAGLVVVQRRYAGRLEP